MYTVLTEQNITPAVQINIMLDWRMEMRCHKCKNDIGNSRLIDAIVGNRTCPICGYTMALSDRQKREAAEAVEKRIVNLEEEVNELAHRD